MEWSWEYITNASYQDAVDRSDEYESMMNKIDSYIGQIERKLEIIRDAYATDDAILDANDDCAEGKFYIIYQCMCRRHKSRKNTVYEHFESCLGDLRERRDYFEEQKNEWRYRADEIKREDQEEE